MTYHTFDPERTMRKPNGEKPWRDEDVLRELYIKKRYSLSKIGDLLGCDPKTVQYNMKKHGIDRRSIAETNRLKNRRRPAIFKHVDGYELWKHFYDYEVNYVAVHRLLAVSEYGFDSVRDKEVHHINGIKWDNRPDNIMVMDPIEHRRMHAKESVKKRDRHPNGNLK